jgi:hypothetical protein
MARGLPALRAALALAAALNPSAGLAGSQPMPEASAASNDPRWLAGAQATLVGFYLPRFRSRLGNPELSFGPGPAAGWSFVGSVLLGARLWEGATVVAVPEYADGRGAPNVSGVSGYPDGNIIRVTKVGTAPYVARAFFHQDVALGPPVKSGEEDPEARFAPTGPFALRRERPASRVEITVGKFATNDFFDLADASSDPRHRFLDWALMQQGAWDYAADTRGYTWGIEVGLETPGYAARAGGALMPTTANGPVYDAAVGPSGSVMVEGEIRWAAAAGRGSARLLGWVNRARAGSYAEALASASAGVPPDVDSVARRGTAKYGVALLVQQQIGPASGFLRAGWNDGRTETFCFTEIDRSLSAGAALDGEAWGRGGDAAGLGVAASGLSPSHAAYLAAGGKGFQLGDGGLSYGWEGVAEGYYSFQVLRGLLATADFQAIWNPGMNAARGPAFLAGLRLHAHL